MAVDAALIAAGSAVVGDVMQSQGAQATNAQSMKMMYAQDAFNARQSLANKRFQHNEAQLQRQWSAREVGAQDQFQERMADTQMQRRVRDLRRAGLNPALAYTQGGAAAPSGATPTSGTPSGSQASAVGVPGLQNPNLGFGQLGGQVASAEQLRSTINLQDAQANKLNVESGTEIPASVELLKSRTALTDMQAQEVYKNVQLLEVQLEPANTSDASMAATLQKMRVAIASMDAQTQQQTMAALIRARNDKNFAEGIHAENIAAASDTFWGKLMAIFEVSQPVVGTAQQAAHGYIDYRSIPFE